MHAVSCPDSGQNSPRAPGWTRAHRRPEVTDSIASTYGYTRLGRWKEREGRAGRCGTRGDQIRHADARPGRTRWSLSLTYLVHRSFSIYATYEIHFLEINVVRTARICGLLAGRRVQG